MITSRTVVVAAMLAVTVPALTACSPSPHRETVGEYMDDATITTRVKAALVDDPNVSAAQVNVETYRGIVQLSGFVDSEADARRAAELARNVPGVHSVKNDIRIKPTHSR